MMIDLELFRIFYVVAEVGNITKASEQLCISQPAVTKHIKNLESQLNTPLFIRTKKGVVLNEYGQKIFLDVKNALTLLDEVSNTIKEYNDLNIGTIKIGISTTLMRKYLLKYIEIFHNNYPNIVVDIYTDPTKDLITKLKNGMIDLVIGKIPNNFDNDLKYHELNKTKYIFMANKNYFDLRNITLKPNDLAKYPILLQEYPSNSRISAENYFESNHVSIEPKMNIASSNLLFDFINLGYGIGYVTELYVKDDIKKGILYKVNVQPEPEKISFGIITLKNNVMTNSCKKFIETLKKNK
jgi:DNA-binding transcriptional LysR family regulator